MLVDAYGIRTVGKRATHMDAEAVYALADAAGASAATSARRAIAELAPSLRRAPCAETGGAFTPFLCGPLDVALALPLARDGAALPAGAGSG